MSCLGCIALLVEVTVQRELVELEVATMAKTLDLRSQLKPRPIDSNPPA